MWKLRLAILLVIILLPGVILAPVWSLAGLGAGEDDILYYFPTRTFFHETLSSGNWPWLNPWTGLGRPFTTDPQTAVWYPATWLFAIMSPIWAYPISLWAHYSLALGGMYRLLRRLALDRRAALFGGIAFAFCGFLLAHRAHLTMQHAAAWAPWVFWSLHRYVLDSPPAGRAHTTRGVRRLALAASVLALQCFAGHIQIAVITAVGVLVFLLAQGQGARRSQPASYPGRFQIAARWLIAWVCAAGLFAVQWFPTFVYLRQCTRVDRGYWDFVENSWHPVSVLGWFLPMLFGQRTPNFFDQPYWGPSHQVEQFSYAGLVPLLLAALALRAGWRADSRRRTWIVLGLFGLLLALGTYGPLCPIIYWIPGGSLFRCPARAIVLVNLAMAALAALTLHDLGSRLSPPGVRLRALATRWTRRPFLLGVLLVAIPLALVLAGVPWLDNETRAAALHAVLPWRCAVWVPLVIMLAALTALAVVVRHWRQPRLLWVLVGITAIDLGLIGWTIDVPAERGTSVALLTPCQEADWMDTVRTSPHRLWVVNRRRGNTPGEYVDPIDKAVANTNVPRRITSLTDYGPLQPRAVVERFGFQPWGESWKPESLLADTRWMRAYNVGWVLLCDVDQPPPNGCDLVTTTAAGWRLFKYPSASGWAFFEAAGRPGAVRFVRQSPSEFTLRVDSWPSSDTGGAGVNMSAWPRVVVSQLALPGWTAERDAGRVPIETVDGTLMGVRVPPGEAVEITWAYFPTGLRTGAAISLLCAMVLFAAAVSASVAEKCSRGPRWQRPAARPHGGGQSSGRH